MTQSDTAGAPLPAATHKQVLAVQAQGFKNLHNIMDDCRFEEEAEADVMSDMLIIARDARTYRIEPELQAAAQRICRANNTTLSQFLRRVCLQLRLEYP